MKKPISTDQRKHMDYLRRNGLSTGALYRRRLLRLRHDEVKRVLSLCSNYDDRNVWASIITGNLDERPYLPKWEKSLFVAVGVPRAKSEARSLSRGKASLSGEYEKTLSDYAAKRAGNLIVSVSGTLKDNLVSILQSQLEADDGVGVELLTHRIMADYNAQAEWEVRRIAQTETMIGMGEAGDAAAKSLDIGYTKQWCVSGLANTRESHLMMDGTVVDEDEAFELPGGMMMYPHDTSMGASAGEIVNCACDCIRMPK